VAATVADLFLCSWWMLLHPFERREDTCAHSSRLPWLFYCAFTAVGFAAGLSWGYCIMYFPVRQDATGIFLDGDGCRIMLD